MPRLRWEPLAVGLRFELKSLKKQQQHILGDICIYMYTYIQCKYMQKICIVGYCMYTHSYIYKYSYLFICLFILIYIYTYIYAVGIHMEYHFYRVRFSGGPRDRLLAGGILAAIHPWPRSAGNGDQQNTQPPVIEQDTIGNLHIIHGLLMGY